MQAASALGRIVELVRDLRARCAWDAAQTRETLRPYLVEEVLELDQDLATGDVERIRDELGDLLLHLAFQIVLGEEHGEFGADDVARVIEAKMWRRHPHLFPQRAAFPASSAHSQGRQERQEVSSHTQASWERLKRDERRADRPGLLDGLPPTLPALIMAFRLQERAAGVGFDWPDTRGPIAKVREELGELEQELGKREEGREAGKREEGKGAGKWEEGRGKSEPEADAAIESELGDLLFSVVNLSRKAGVDARTALEKANVRFLERFRFMEQLATKRGIDVGAATLETLDGLWEEAKRQNRQ